MWRKLFTLAAAVSVVLFVAASVPWAWSRRAAHFVGYGRDREWAGAPPVAGVLRFGHGGYAGGFAGRRYTPCPSPAGGLGGEARAPGRSGGRLRGLGFATARAAYTAGGSRVRRAAYVPHWFVALVLGAIPAAWTTASVRRVRPGYCRSCGYDLRATPGRCPECEIVPAGKGAAG